MTGKTLSFVKGKGSLRHNNRDFIADNVDRNRTPWNRTYAKVPLSEAYEICFGDAVREYNEGQTRKDRKKDNYLEEIRHSGNNEKVFYENVVQIGTMKDTSVVDENGNLTPEAEKAIKVLDEYGRTFQERNPNLYLFNAVLHLDEATPHLHLDYIPVAHGYKRGLKTRNSLTKAFQEMGFEKGRNKRDNETIDWQRGEREHLTSLCEERGIEIVVLGVDRDDYSLPEYKEIMAKLSEKEAEIEILNEQKEEAASEITSLKEEQKDLIADANKEKAQIEKDIRDASKELSRYQLTKEVMESVSREVKADISHTKGQAVISKNPLTKEEYVRIPKGLWDKMLSAYEWALRHFKTVDQLTKTVRSLKSEVSDLKNKLNKYQIFIKEHGLLEALEEFLHPKRRSVLKKLEKTRKELEEFQKERDDVVKVGEYSRLRE